MERFKLVEEIICFEVDGPKKAGGLGNLFSEAEYG
jgi:hypothetical protein